MSSEPRSVLVLGARNLGGAIARAFAADGHQVAAMARSAPSLAPLDRDGLLTITGDAADPEGLAAGLASARESFGRVDVVVNAVAAVQAGGDGPFGGGPVWEAPPERFATWTAAVAEQAFTFLSVGARTLREQGGGGTLIQVTGGSARRANAGVGLWAAGCAAVRALTHATALEQREHGIHVALLIVDGVIASPKTAAYTRDAPAESLVDQAEVARTAVLLAGQHRSALTHELQITPSGDRWVP